MRRSVVAIGVLAALVDSRGGPERAGLTRVPSSGLVDVVVTGSAPMPHAHALAPGLQLARMRADEVDGLSATDTHFAILPKLHRATDLAIPIINVPTVEAQGFTGKGVYVGMVDSGFDVRHPAFRDASGATRFAWLLDYSRRIRGKYPSLEATYGIGSCLARQADGTASDHGACSADPRCPDELPCAVTEGAVYSGSDLDALLASASEPLPTDEEGHGTLAMGIAAGSHLTTTPFRGVAAEAKLVGVKAGGTGSSIDADVVAEGVQFVFDRAADAGVPASVNLSLAADFVVRDGTDPLGPSIAALARGPGRIIVVAAGNSGDTTVPTHQSASVAPGEHVRIGVRALKGIPSESVQIIVSPHPGSDVHIGCETTGGDPWVTPVARGLTRSATVDGNVANVIFDASDFHGRLPDTSSSALVLLDGNLATGAHDFYGIVLEGSGAADLWVAGGLFEYGVREQTVGSPAMHPDLIAVGASVSRTGYRSLAGQNFVLQSQLYDQGGMIPLIGVGGPPAPGQIAAFSGAGPGPMGVIKPDLVAPGVAIVSAATSTGSADSLLIGTGNCPPLANGSKTSDDHCSYVDADHAAATGTSFAAPFVTGAAAILLELDPTLTQAEMRVALQAGVHQHRSPPRFPESASIGELDVAGALTVVERMRHPLTVYPTVAHSWLTANSHYVPSDGSRPLEVLAHLAGVTNDPADGFDVDRFAITMHAGDELVAPSRLERLGPGLWTASFDAGRRGASSVTLEATFDRSPVTAPLSLPVAPDPWQARYPTGARGASCAIARGHAPMSPWLFVLALGALVVRRR